MRKIETCISPDLVHLHDLEGKTVVVVDIFRASSTMVTALSNGVHCIKPLKDLEECRSYKDQNWLIAGERDGKQAEGFDLGNSPLAFLDNIFAGKNLAMTTTNGTRAISLAENDSREILIGAFLNLQATVDYLKGTTNDVLVLCAGWKGKFNLEDSLFAGALSLELGWKHNCDATLAMEALFQKAEKNLTGFLQKASHTKRLQNHQLEKDIDFCLHLNKYRSVIYLDSGLLKMKPSEKNKKRLSQQKNSLNS
ncbi:2-phosphosulfolactate phosphatase [Cyclobacterium jeungdonense]|uniref:Probable 2-phosphosulfolactate phosphatase n=1 Tax=Cyclobacterium jeungdonense TaxID=708087 RepID=A0ABT8C7W0_9BACT|nr:2-phosphosulfolactate phosphatase [Cyclobacterium jeungdonense]MDN3688152.1 2-phosphosulfolactate phosphatase [Cyclobacterium jeungdonense]